MKIVINDTHGGFNLSPPAALICYERGMTSLAENAIEYYGSAKKADEAFKADPNRLMTTQFSADGKLVIQSTTNDRANPTLVGVVEELGLKANGFCAELAVVEWPDELPWTISEYDGLETVVLDTREFEGWSDLSLTDDVMKDLMNRCRVYYQLKHEEA